MQESSEGKKTNAAEVREDIEGFKRAVERVASAFRKIPSSETVRLISHLDADGISAVALMAKALNRQNMMYSMSILPQLKAEDVKLLANENHKYYVFTDLGSSQLSSMLSYLKGKVIFVLDHHQPEDVDNEKLLENNIYHVNPHLFSIDGSTKISGAGVTFYFVRALNTKNEDLAHIAIIGTIGDVQEPMGSKLNQEIVDIAKKHNKIEVIKGLRIFGAQTKPLHRALVQSTDFYIPGVTGSESGAIQFLKQLEIEPKENGKWRRIIDLKDEELKRLVEGIIMMRFGEENPEDILGNIYLLNDEEEGSTLKDAKEFATVLNACGRLGRASLGVGACLGDKRLKVMAVEALNDYRKELVSALKWFEKNRNSEKVVEEPGFLIINAGEEVLSTIIGTVASIISRSSAIPKNTFIVSMARMMDGHTKISIRYSGNRSSHSNGINLKEILQRVIVKFDGEAGGHVNAAGAYIKTEQEQAFIDHIKSVLRRVSVEERIT